MTEEITLTVEGEEIKAIFATPEGEGPFPGIVLTYHKGGMDPFTHWLADDLARAGFVTVCPDHFHWLPEGVSTDDRKDHLFDTRIAADLAVSRGYLECLDSVNGDSIGIVGHCMGGRNAFLGIGVDPHYQAACIWYSGGMFRAQGGDGPSPFDRLENVTCPVMGFFGNNDKNPSPDDVSKFDAALTAAGAEHEFHQYDNTGHGFMDPDHDGAYVESSAKDSWGRALKFLTENLA